MVLQERDLLIVEFLNKMGWSLSSHISDIFFKKNPKYAWERLNKLEREGLVMSKKASFLKKNLIKKQTLNFLFSFHPSSINLYRLSDRMLNFLGNKISHSVDERLAVHQLMASYIYKEFKNRYLLDQYSGDEGARILSKCSDFHTFFSDSEPDIVLYLNDKKIAIEVERKARRRLSFLKNDYEDRINSLSVHYDLVLYVMENQKDLNKMIDLSVGLHRVGFSSIFNLNEVYIKGQNPVILDNFLER